MSLLIALDNATKSKKITLEEAACILDSVLNERPIQYACRKIVSRMRDYRSARVRRSKVFRILDLIGDRDEAHVSALLSKSATQKNGKERRGHSAPAIITASIVAAPSSETRVTFRLPKQFSLNPKDINLYLYNRLKRSVPQKYRAYLSNSTIGEDVATITFSLNCYSAVPGIRDVFRRLQQNCTSVSLNEVCEILSRIGRLYGQASMHSEAMRYHLAALRLNPQDVFCIHQYAEFLKGVGRLDEACEILRAALEMRRDRHITYLMLAELEGRRGNLNDAVEMAKSAMFYKKDLHLVHKALSFYLARARRVQSAIETVETSITLNDQERSFVEYIISNTSEEDYNAFNHDVTDFKAGGYEHWFTHGIDEGRSMPGAIVVTNMRIPGEEWRQFLFRGKYISVKIPETNTHPLLDCIWRSEMNSHRRQLSEEIEVDVIIPVYRGYEDTVRCIKSVLSDPDRLPGRIIVIDDKSPDTKLRRWLQRQHKVDGFVLLQNEQNLGFVSSVNRGMRESKNDVVLLNSDTEVPAGWLRRLALHAYAKENVGTVTPLSNNATIFSYPAPGHAIINQFSLVELDRAAQIANRGHAIKVPTAMGFAMYIKRRCFEDVGLFNEEAFGKGYGEENDFCIRAVKRGWLNVAACDTFVYHAGEVSFGSQSSLKDNAELILDVLHPEYKTLLYEWVRCNPLLSTRLAITLELLKSSKLPIVLLVSHAHGGGVERHIDDIVRYTKGRAHYLLLTPSGNDFILNFPSLKDHPEVKVLSVQADALLEYLKRINISQVHIHHIMGFGPALQKLVMSLNAPIDFTVHDYYALCPRVTFFDPNTQTYCGEPNQQRCNECISRDFVNGASDILSWRLDNKWLFQNSNRIICPSEDVLKRLLSYGVTDKTLLAPHI